MIQIVKFKTLLAAVFILGVSHTVGALDNSTDIIEISTDNFENELEKRPLLVMIYQPGYVLQNSLHDLKLYKLQIRYSNARK